MRLFVAVTDWDWFRFLRSRPQLEEVNFWRPSGRAGFAALAPGDALLLKLHAPRRAIAGLGWYEGFCRLPVRLAWTVFGEGNGATSLAELEGMLARYRRGAPPSVRDEVGCVMLRDPTLFPEEAWIEEPEDWAPNIVQGKGYDSTTGVGRSLWDQVVVRLGHVPAQLELAPAAAAAPVEFQEVIGRRRLGQGAFRALVTDTYERRCVVTGERVLPVLEACHIRPAANGGSHDVRNGILLRSDLHTLFDQGYLAVDPGSRRLEVSRRLRQDYENGREYYQLQGRELRHPSRRADTPATEFFEWHRSSLFLG